MGQLNAYLETLLNGTTHYSGGIWAPGSYSTEREENGTILVLLCGRQKDIQYRVKEADIRSLWNAYTGFLSNNSKAFYVLSVLQHPRPYLLRSSHGGTQ